MTESATVTGQQAGGPATQDLGRGALEQKLARAEQTQQREWAWSMAATNTSESSERSASLFVLSRSKTRTFSGPT